MAVQFPPLSSHPPVSRVAGKTAVTRAVSPAAAAFHAAARSASTASVHILPAAPKVVAAAAPARSVISTAPKQAPGAASAATTTAAASTAKTTIAATPAATSSAGWLSALFPDKGSYKTPATGTTAVTAKAVSTQTPATGQPAVTTPATTPDTPAATSAAAALPSNWPALLFPDKGSYKTPVAAQPAPVESGPPTAEQVFGPNPWLQNPTGIGPDGNAYSYNPQFFATPQTAAAVAAMTGGTVVEADEFTGGAGTYQQQQPNEMVRLANGALINPGLVAGFYTHGYSQSFVDQMIANEVANTKA